MKPAPLTPMLGARKVRKARFFREPATDGFKNGGLMGARSKTRRLFEFVLWAQQQQDLPSAKQIAARFGISLPVAYRWRELYAELTGQEIPCMGTGRRRLNREVSNG